MVKRYILTGAPGAGKTAILRRLELDGFGVVEEAATDLIAARQAEGVAEPWREPGFVEAVAALQRERLEHAARTADEIQFHDRSAVCTVALARYLALPCPDSLMREARRLRRDGVFEGRVLFVRNLGFVEPTAVRRIRFEETLRFEGIHEDTYRELGFDLLFVERGSVADRVKAIRAACR
jgi:predicted ATPase